MDWEPTISPQEVAAALGVNIQKVWRLIREKELPAERIGRSYRITKTDYEKFVAEQTKTI